MMLLIRADANGTIGSGHLMRCLSYARAAMDEDIEVVIAVSEHESASKVEEFGLCAVVLETAFDCYSEKAAYELAQVAEAHSASWVLVDSYYVNGVFFKKLREGCSAQVAYMDDQYLASDGRLVAPVCWDVDAVVNYSFAASDDEYGATYKGANVLLILGPQFAPVRKAFSGDTYACVDEVRTVLVTSGATNPDHTLEKMVEGVHAALPKTLINVVIGGHASIDFDLFDAESVRTFEGWSDLSLLMKESDLAVSAAGSTLYELAALGVPTVAVPIVENQVANAAGFSSRGLGLAVRSIGWSTDDVAVNVSQMAESLVLREQCASAMRRTVDVDGAKRVVRMLFDVG